jgi:hypothetical protein
MKAKNLNIHEISKTVYTTININNYMLYIQKPLHVSVVSLSSPGGRQMQNKIELNDQEIKKIKYYKTTVCRDCT